MKVLELQNGESEETKFKKQEALSKIMMETIGKNIKGKLDLNDLKRLGA